MTVYKDLTIKDTRGDEVIIGANSEDKELIEITILDRDNDKLSYQINTAELMQAIIKVKEEI